MPKLSEIYLYQSYFMERGSNPDRYPYGKKKTNLSTSYAITQQQSYPRLGKKKVTFSTGTIVLSQINFGDARTSLYASRSFTTVGTSDEIQMGQKSDKVVAGLEVQIWNGVDFLTGAGSDSIIISGVRPSDYTYLGEVMYVGGMLDMGEGDDEILINATIQDQQTLQNKPGLRITRGTIDSDSGKVAMGSGDDLIRINSLYSTSLQLEIGAMLLTGDGNDTIDILYGGMSIAGAVHMGDGDDRFSIGQLGSNRGARLWRGSNSNYVDPIIHGGEGSDLISLPAGNYTVSTDSLGVRIKNEATIDITLASFELVAGASGNDNAIQLVDGNLQIFGATTQYI